MPQPQQNLVRSMNSNKYWPYIAGACGVVILGVVGAWLISSKFIAKSTPKAAPGSIVTSTSAGMLDPNTKYDTATGNLKDGGLNGTGTHHLENDNGPSHYVYLTSSVVDLSQFVGKKVQVWGQTLASKTVPWLMDVAKVQVVQ